MLLSRPVAQSAVVNQRGRTTAVEVERLARAELDEHVCELGQRHSGVLRRAAVAHDGQQPVARDRQSGARVAALRDVGVELMRSSGEALDVLAIAHDTLSTSYEQRSRLQQVAVERRRKLV